MKMKSIDDYMKIHYPIEITKIPEEEGGGYSAKKQISGIKTLFTEIIAILTDYYQ